MNLLSRFGGRIWDPRREMGQLQNEMNRLLSGARVYAGVAPREFPLINLYTNAQTDELLLTLEVPGIDPEKIDVTVTGATVTLRGERVGDDPRNVENFHRRERPVGSFEREVKLPFDVDPSRTEACYAKGVLKLKMTRPESLKPRKVAVKSA